MKRIYASIAMALTVGGAAYAGNVNTVALEKQTATLDVAEVERAVASETVSIKQAAPASDIASYFQCNWVGRTSGTIGQQKEGIQVTIDGEDVTISGIWKMAVLKGTYNAATGKLRIPGGQETFYTGDGEPLKWYWDQLTVEQNQITKETELPYAELEYYPNGVKNTQGEIMLTEGFYLDPYTQLSLNNSIHRGTTSGYTWLYAIQFQSVNEAYNMEKVTFGDDEWENVGEAEFDDGWFRAYDGEGYSAYKVPCLKNKKNEKLLALENPYGATSPYTTNNINISGKTVKGYIVIDITEPKCVLVRPFINSGFNINQFFSFTSGTGGDAYHPTQGFFACTNAEGGRYYIDGWSTENIIEEAETYGDPIAVLKDNTIDMPTCRVQKPMNDNPPSAQYLAAGQWTNRASAPIPMESKIVLPAGALSDNSVQDIAADVENAPVKYFNLQGVEISNPEAGALVIVKQGSKVNKTIVK